MFNQLPRLRCSHSPIFREVNLFHHAEVLGTIQFNDQVVAMIQKKPIICLGIMVADVVGRPLRTLPAPGRLVLVDKIGLHTGGCAINSAIALAHLGLPAEVIGRIGDDPFGDFLMNALHKYGVGTQGVKRDGEVGTSSTMVMVEPNGERRFIHYIGANARLSLDDVDISMVENASILHVAGTLVMPGIDGEPTAQLLRLARASGVTTFLDTVWDDTGRWMKVLEPCLKHIDYFVPSLPEAQALTRLNDPSDVARALIELGVRTVALKMGVDGCLVMSDDEESIHLPAYKVMVVDATGAGEAELRR